MAGNLKHLFIDGRRVTFDRRDDSVTLFPDTDFRFLGAERIGTARGSHRDWIATTPNGRVTQLGGRKACALWLIEQTAETRSERATRMAHDQEVEELAVEEAMEILKQVRRDPRPPASVSGDPRGKAFFVFHPWELRDLLRDVRDLNKTDD